VSRIGKKPIKFSNDVDVKIDGSRVIVKGPKGELETIVDSAITINVNEENNEKSIQLSFGENTKDNRRKIGLYRSLISNNVDGVVSGYTKVINLVGIGYRASLSGKKLELSLGYSHNVSVDPVDGVDFQVPSQNKIIISGIDKEKVGQQTVKISTLRKYDPYKGKGLLIEGKLYTKKQGKSVGKKG
tara:strand:+ start:1163 stop:1720 length:558 start_codon:yes stop_codon:yes gene_type:complete